jgi:23S rRNA pseudouridine1911/1915/1917 synthase
MPAAPERRLHLVAEIEPAQAGLRVDQAAAQLFTRYSRTLLAEWIRAGRLTVDGRAVAAKHRVHGGERIAVDVEEPVTPGPDAPQQVDFRIVYEDDDLLVVDKPAGLVVHPGAGNPDRTLVNGLLAHRRSLEALPRAGVVHRIDKDTGGLLVVAATAEAQRALSRAIARHEVSRRYAAVVEGVLTGGRDIDAAIARDPHDRRRQRVSDAGRAALTRVRVREKFRAATLIDATLETGRTHQIRVHLASIGHPLVGDRRYGARGRLPPRPTERLVTTMRAFRRQALHAVELGFAHPSDGRWLAFSSPLPPDFEELLAALREDRDVA